MIQVARKQVGMHDRIPNVLAGVIASLALGRYTCKRLYWWSVEGTGTS